MLSYILSRPRNMFLQLKQTHLQIVFPLFKAWLAAGRELQMEIGPMPAQFLGVRNAIKMSMA